MNKKFKKTANYHYGMYLKEEKQKTIKYKIMMQQQQLQNERNIE